MLAHPSRADNERERSIFLTEFRRITKFKDRYIFKKYLYADLPDDIEEYLQSIRLAHIQLFNIEFGDRPPDFPDHSFNTWSNAKSVNHLSSELSIIDEKSSAMLTANSIHFAIMLFTIQFVPNFPNLLTYFMFFAVLIIAFTFLSVSIFNCLRVSSISWTNPKNINFGNPPYNLYIERTLRTIAHRVSLISTRISAFLIATLVFVEIVSSANLSFVRLNQ